MELCRAGAHTLFALRVICWPCAAAALCVHREFLYECVTVQKVSFNFKCSQVLDIDGSIEKLGFDPLDDTKVRSPCYFDDTLRGDGDGEGRRRYL